MSSVRKKGGSRPNRGGGRFNRNQRGHGRGGPSNAPGKPRAHFGGARKQDSFQFEDEVLEFPDEEDQSDEPWSQGAYQDRDSRGATGGRGSGGRGSGGRGRGRGQRTKVEMQHIHMSEENQDMVREMLLALHGNSVAADSEDAEYEYQELNWRAENQYWTRDRQLVVEAAAKNDEEPQLITEEQQLQRFTQLAVAKLARYGFAEERCEKALEQTNGDVGSALEYLISTAFDLPLPEPSTVEDYEETCLGVVDEEEGNFNTTENDTSENATENDDHTDWEWVREQREEECQALEAIYAAHFCRRIKDHVWTLDLDLPKLSALATQNTGDLDKSKRKASSAKTLKKNSELCRFYIKGHCRFGSNCQFRHQAVYEQETPATTAQVSEFEYQLEIRFPRGNRYPLDVPFLAFQSTNRLLPNHVSLNITSRLVQEARQQVVYGLPLVFTLASVLDEEETLKDCFYSPPHRFSMPEPIISKRISSSQQREISAKKSNTVLTSNRRDDQESVRKPSAKPEYEDVLGAIAAGNNLQSPLVLSQAEAAGEKSKKDSLVQEDLHKKYGRRAEIPAVPRGREREQLDRRLRQQFIKTQNERRYKEMQEARHKLPISSEQQRILEVVRKNQVTVLCGMTGCGKSTQVPQFLLDASFETCAPSPLAHIVVTQPRRISAIGVAERVAAERTERVGGVVGYQIRLESSMSPRTRVLFCTTGIILRRLEADPYLNDITHIIVDEVHERSQESDFLLLILRDLLPNRPNLKVMLMSATVNAELFSSYFGGCPVINVPGQTYPVDEYFLEDTIELLGYTIEETSPYARPLKGMNAEANRRATRPKVEEIEEALANVDLNGMPPKNHILDTNLTPQQLYLRYSGYKALTVRQLAVMDHECINFDLVVSLIEWICTAEHDFPRQGAILVFVMGLSDIQNLYNLLKSNKVLRNTKEYRIVPLHSSLSSHEQRAVFVRPPEGVRKIVLSTNMAETSVTIDDVVYVIDCGLIKEKHYDVTKGMESLDTEWVSRASAMQRRGRAGRVTSGICFHLYTGHRYDYHFADQPVPEMQRACMEATLLRVKTVTLFRGQPVCDVMSRLLEAPSNESVRAALTRLHSLGALDANDELTPLGFHLSALPVDVRIGKLMLFGCIFRCLDPALTIAAALSHRSLFVAPFGRKAEATAKKAEFAVGNSDHLTTLRAYQAYMRASNEGHGNSFASQNYICTKTVQLLAGMKRQFVELLADIGFVQQRLTSRDVDKMATTGSDGVLAATGHTLNHNSENMRLVAAILVAALYPNVVQVLSPESKYKSTSAGAIAKEPQPGELRFKTKEDGYVNIHPSSVNYQVHYFPSPYLVYHQKMRTSRLFIRDCSMVSVYPLLLFAGGALSVDLDRGHFVLSVDEGWIRFRVSNHQVAELIREVRLELDQLLRDKIETPDLDLCACPRGNRIITTIVRLITTQ